MRAHELCGAWGLYECKCWGDTDEIKILYIRVLALGFVYKCGYSMIIQWPSWETDIGDPEIQSLEQVVTDLSTKLSILIVFTRKTHDIHIVLGHRQKGIKNECVYHFYVPRALLIKFENQRGD